MAWSSICGSPATFITAGGQNKRTPYLRTFQAGMSNLDATVATVETVEILLRLAAVLLTGLAASYIWLQVARRKIRPSLVWIYVGVVATTTFVWRGIVLLMLFIPELRTNMIEWITPITATMYCLSAVSLMMLVFCGSRRRTEDE